MGQRSVKWEWIWFVLPSTLPHTYQTWAQWHHCLESLHHHKVFNPNRHHDQIYNGSHNTASEHHKQGWAATGHQDNKIIGQIKNYSSHHQKRKKNYSPKVKLLMCIQICGHSMLITILQIWPNVKKVPPPTAQEINNLPIPYYSPVSLSQSSIPHLENTEKTNHEYVFNVNMKYHSFADLVTQIFTNRGRWLLVVVGFSNDLGHTR